MSPTIEGRELFTSGEVRERAGITYRQLDYWISVGLIWPYLPAHGSGSRVLFDHEDLAWIEAISDLTAAGVLPERIKGAKGDPQGFADALQAAAARFAAAAPAWFSEDEKVRQHA